MDTWCLKIVLAFCRPSLRHVGTLLKTFPLAVLQGNISSSSWVMCLINDIQQNFMDTVFVERILQWRVAAQDLIHVGFKVGFLLDHLQEIACVFFRMKAQPSVDSIDARIERLKEITNLEAHCELLLSVGVAPDGFKDNPFVTGLM